VLLAEPSVEPIRSARRDMRSRMQPLAHRTVLVLGGARSGKSRYAQALVEASGFAAVFIATATAGDGDMAARIARHKAERDARWRTVEEPLALAEALRRETAPERAVLVDCLTLWLSNLMLGGHNVDAGIDGAASAIVAAAGPLVVVSNEVGLGIVPESPLGRDFRDAQGRLNQIVAAACEAVVLMSAGLPLVIKPAPGPHLKLT
jgi:adenosylcobinamide kinase/adenosylcobinamide-phosphate guanylyltransferase